LIWFLLILIPVAYYVQEMTVRLGAVTKRGLAEAIFDGFGAFWGWFSLLDLMIVDWLTLVTEFVGMTAALAVFGVPPWLTVVAVTVLMAVIVLNGRYWTFEKLALLFCVLNLIYIPGAFLVHPSVQDVVHQGLIPNLAGGLNGQLFFFLMANIGTTIAPWMLFFQQSAVVDKGMLEKDIPWGRFDTLLGSIFGWAHSLNTRIREAPWFYATYLLMLVTAGLVVLIPHAPLVLITLFVQVIAVTLLPAALVFLILLLNDRTAVGEYCNTPAQNLVGGCIVVSIVIL